MIEPPASVYHLFLEAGWHPGRLVTVPSRVPTDHPAALVLAQFGGLTVGHCDSGEECATSDVAFRLLSADKCVHVWQELLHSRLVGVADVHEEHAELYLDDSGRYFGRSCMHDAFYYEGATFTEAIERLLLGRRSRPMLRPDQATVDMYGEVINADHPSVLKYS